MNPYECRIELRPRTPFEVFDLAFTLVRVWLGPLARVAALVVVPATLAALLTAWLSGDLLAVTGAVFLLSPVIQAPVTLLCSRMLFSDPPRAREVVMEVVRQPGRLGVLLFAQFLLMVCSGCSALLLYLPVRVAVLFFPETLLLEGVPVGRATRRAWLLASEQLGKAVIGAGVLVATEVWALLAAEAAGQALVNQVLGLGAPFGRLILGEPTVYVLLGLIAVQIPLAVFRLLLYVDLRTALEGWDLQVSLRAAGEDA